MSVFITLKGDKRADKEKLAAIRDLMGESVFNDEVLEAEEFGEVLYAALRLNGKLPKAAKPWKRLSHEEQLKWGGIASLVYWAIEDRGSLRGKCKLPSDEGFECDDDLVEDDADGFEDLKAAEDKGAK